MGKSMVAREVLQTIRHRCSRTFICATIFCIIVSRIVGVFLHTVWICDCFFREFKVGSQCKNFSLFLYPEEISAIWLAVVILTSLLLIFYTNRLPEYPGLKSITSHLLRKKYFYKLCVILILVIIFDLINILGGEIQVKQTAVFTTFMLEHVTTVALMFTLNFVPKFVKNTTSHWTSFKTAVYKMILLLYSIENYVIYALGTMIAAYKLIAIPTCRRKLETIRYNISRMSTSAEGNTVCHDATSVAMLLLLLVARSLRHTLGEFFLTKIFRENADNLDTPSQPNTLQETTDNLTGENAENTRLLTERY